MNKNSLTAGHMDLATRSDLENKYLYHTGDLNFKHEVDEKDIDKTKSYVVPLKTKQKKHKNS